MMKPGLVPRGWVYPIIYLVGTLLCSSHLWLCFWSFVR